MSQHRDRDTDWDREQGEPQRQSGQPGPRLALETRNQKDHHDTERQEDGGRCDPQELAAFVVGGPAKAQR